MTGVTNRRKAEGGGADFYPTPLWATHALMLNEPFEGSVWEPACGDGSMADVIGGYGHEVVGTDLYGYGGLEGGCDFLEADASLGRNIITNPPYNLAQRFVEHSIELAEGKVAMLLRLAFLEGAKRAATVFKDNPPSRLWVFSERITFYPGGIQTAGSGTTAYAWFVWDPSHEGSTELRWIAPGLKNDKSLSTTQPRLI